jgi:hypothetical protein
MLYSLSSEVELEWGSSSEYVGGLTCINTWVYERVHCTAMGILLSLIEDVMWSKPAWIYLLSALGGVKIMGLQVAVLLCYRREGATCTRPPHAAAFS